MIPYCKHTGIGIIPWSPLARGALTRPWGERGTYREKTDRFLQNLIRNRETEVDKAIVDRVEEVSKALGVSMAAVATAWSIAKGWYVELPILFGRERVLMLTWQLSHCWAAEQGKNRSSCPE